MNSITNFTKIWALLCIPGLFLANILISFIMPTVFQNNAYFGMLYSTATIVGHLLVFAVPYFIVLHKAHKKSDVNQIAKAAGAIACILLFFRFNAMAAAPLGGILPAEYQMGTTISLVVALIVVGAIGYFTRSVRLSE